MKSPRSAEQTSLRAWMAGCGRRRAEETCCVSTRTDVRWLREPTRQLGLQLGGLLACPFWAARLIVANLSQKSARWTCEYCQGTLLLSSKTGQIADVVWSREKISHWNCRGLRFLLDATCPLKSAAPPSHASSTSLLLHERVTRIRPRRQRSDAQRILVSRELARQER